MHTEGEMKDPEDTLGKTQRDGPAGRSGETSDKTDRRGALAKMGRAVYTAPALILIKRPSRRDLQSPPHPP